MFGFTNSAFTSLAFALLIYQSYQQQQDLTLQRKALDAQHKELELTRDELSRSAAAQERSDEALRSQLDLQLKVAQLAAITDEIERCQKARESINNHLVVPNKKEQIMANTKILTKLKTDRKRILEALEIDTLL